MGIRRSQRRSREGIRRAASIRKIARRQPDIALDSIDLTLQGLIMEPAIYLIRNAPHRRRSDECTSCAKRPPLRRVFLIIVTPHTVVRWHRAGFRRYWS